MTDEEYDEEIGGNRRELIAEQKNYLCILGEKYEELYREYDPDGVYEREIDEENMERFQLCYSQGLCFH